MHRFILISACYYGQISQFTSTVRKVILEELKRGDIIEGTEPITHHDPFSLSLFNDVETEDANGDDIANLKDTKFEADGSTIDINQYAWPALVDEDVTCSICLEILNYLDPSVDSFENLPLGMDACGHLSHRQYLATLVNGTEKHCSKCSICRKKICPRRPRRRVLKEEDGE